MPPSAEPKATSHELCGPLECHEFSTPADAFRHVLETEPLVIGIGEAHALAGFEQLPSTARRFSDELLPVMERRASHLIVELLSPNSRCEATTRDVREAHEPVTAPQSRNNQNDYVELGHRSRALGIEPFVLSPTCEEYGAIANAGGDAIQRTLSTIASVTSRMVRAALVKNREAGREHIVLAYGGALHNDLTPHASRADWSYGPELSSFTAGRYVELDLIVREFIKDNDVWRALPWYEHFEPERHPEKSVVMRIAPRSYVLFFPKARPTAPRDP
jgi:hypothetical protein